MKSFMKFIAKNSLRMTGTAALFLGALFVTQFKMFLFYQPECPETMQK